MHKTAWIGALALLLLLGIYFLYQGSLQIETEFQSAVATEQSRPSHPPVKLSASDVQHLPEPVRRYLAFCSVFGQNKINGFSARMDGQMRLEPRGTWVKITAEQFNFIDQPSRFFYIRAVMFGIPVSGLHAYAQGQAHMAMKVFSLWPIFDIRGGKLNQAETVTFFNDMCLMAPATLIDPRITWSDPKEFSVLATFHAHGQTISAKLFFAADGRLVNFISDDRFMLMPDQTFKKIRWSTPITGYTEQPGRRRVSRAEAIWHLPEGDFTYAKFILKDITDNPPARR